MLYAFERGSKYSASFSTKFNKSTRRFSPLIKISSCCFSYWINFFLPFEKFATIILRATPKDPARAAAPPPPGTGFFDDSSKEKSLHDNSVKFIKSPLIYYNQLYITFKD